MITAIIGKTAGERVFEIYWEVVSIHEDRDEAKDELESLREMQELDGEKLHTAYRLIRADKAEAKVKELNS
jgi:hypothetical protein